MLKHEIEPFADQHIKSLEKVLQTLTSIHSSYSGTAVGITAQHIQVDIGRVEQARQALLRFKTSMLDEVNQKERLESTLSSQD